MAIIMNSSDFEEDSPEPEEDFAIVQLFLPKYGHSSSEGCSKTFTGWNTT
jgi:hypothetical protein